MTMAHCGLHPHIDEAAAFACRINQLKAEIERLRAALKAIAEMEPGSRGAYSKFVRAQSIARVAIEQSAIDPKGG